MTYELQDVGKILNLADYKTKVKKAMFDDGKQGAN